MTRDVIRNLCDHVTVCRNYLWINPVIYVFGSRDHFIKSRDPCVKITWSIYQDLMKITWFWVQFFSISHITWYYRLESRDTNTSLWITCSWSRECHVIACVCVCVCDCVSAWSVSSSAKNWRHTKLAAEIDRIVTARNWRLTTYPSATCSGITCP